MGHKHSHEKQINCGSTLERRENTATVKIYQSAFGTLVEYSTEMSNILKQLQQLRHDFIPTFYAEGFFMVNACKNNFQSFKFFSKR